MKRIAILGSTGSIGQNVLRILRHLPGRFEVVGLAAKSSIDLLEAQIREFSPKMVALFDEEKACELQKRLGRMHVGAGVEGLCAVAAMPDADIVIAAMSGTAGILPTLSALKVKGRRVALANKEALVSAGELIMQEVEQNQIELLPIDSEHSALFQCLNGKAIAQVRRLVLTASGGPFWKKQGEAFSLEEALSHPTWNMGPKVTIDSSTLMNKGLEVIEAHFLFKAPLDKIEVVIHPQSVIHSLVEWCDGSMIAQMSQPNMLIPIQYALTYPERVEGMLPPFDFYRYPSLEFYQPSIKKFPCLNLAFEALRRGGSAPCYLNAANEVLVGRFLQGEIAWREIASRLESLFFDHRIEKIINVEKILEIDILAREQALNV